MSRSFGMSAAKLWHSASVLLGWRPDESWSATPAEHALPLLPPPDRDQMPHPDLIAELRRRFPDE